VAATPIPYSCEYVLRTDETGAPEHIDVTAAGAGWQRRVTMQREAQEWRVTADERGDLDRALRMAGAGGGAGLPGIDDPDRLYDATEVYVSGQPVFFTPTLRRLSIHTNQTVRLRGAWLTVPGLEVLEVAHDYSFVDADQVAISGDVLTTVLAIESDAYVTQWPGVAQLAVPHARLSAGPGFAG
jgi:uncharacterized protein